MIMNTFKAHDIGAPRLPGSTLQSGTSVTITAGGADIWGNRDEFHFFHSSVAGDFDLSARVDQLEMADLYTKAGLMLRASEAPGAPHAMLLTFGDNQLRNKNNGALEFQTRLDDGGDCSGTYPPQPLPETPDFPASFPNHWLRLTRKGDLLTGSFSIDGKNWRVFCSQSQAFPATALLGLAVTAHNDSRTIRARFDNVTLIQS